MYEIFLPYMSNLNHASRLNFKFAENIRKYLGTPLAYSLQNSRGLFQLRVIENI